VAATGSPLGKRILESWEQMLPKFLRIFPHEYRRALAAGEKVGHAVSFPSPVLAGAAPAAILQVSGD
jgi:glutamate synthase domain-containing protein 3